MLLLRPTFCMQLSAARRRRFGDLLVPLDTRSPLGHGAALQYSCPAQDDTRLSDATCCAGAEVRRSVTVKGSKQPTLFATFDVDEELLEFDEDNELYTRPPIDFTNSQWDYDDLFEQVGLSDTLTIAALCRCRGRRCLRGNKPRSCAYSSSFLHHQLNVSSRNPKKKCQRLVSNPRDERNTRLYQPSQRASSAFVICRQPTPRLAAAVGGCTSEHVLEPAMQA